MLGHMQNITDIIIVHDLDPQILPIGTILDE